MFWLIPVLAGRLIGRPIVAMLAKMQPDIPDPKPPRKPNRVPENYYRPSSKHKSSKK